MEAEAPGRRRFFWAACLVLSLGLFFAAAELFARWSLPGGYYVWPPNLRRTFTPAPEVFRGISGPSQFSIDALGMRGDGATDEGRYWILAVGGSTTICMYLDDTEAWPHLVQERLDDVLRGSRVRVGNVGRLGHGTSLHRVQLEKLLDQHPEIDAVVLLIGINDLLHYLSTTLGSDVAEAPVDLVGRAFSIAPAGNDGVPWYWRTGLGRLWTAAHWQNSELRQARMQPDGGNFARWRDHRKAASELLDELPDLRPALSGYGRAVRAILDTVEARGARPILLTQPTLWAAELSESDRDLLWMGGPGLDRLGPGARYYSTAAPADGMRRYNARLLAVCRDRGVECIAAAARLSADSGVFYDDAHFTERGARLLAALVADHLISTEPLASFGE